MNSTICLLTILVTISFSIFSCQAWNLQFPRQLETNLEVQDTNFDFSQQISENLQQAQFLKSHIGGEVELDPIDDLQNGNAIQNMLLAGNPNSRAPPRSLVPSGKTQTLVIALDGFRYDYPKMYPTPNLNK